MDDEKNLPGGQESPEENPWEENKELDWEPWSPNGEEWGEEEAKAPTVEELQKQLEEATTARELAEKNNLTLKAQAKKFQSQNDSNVAKLENEIKTLQEFQDKEGTSDEDRNKAWETRLKKQEELMNYRASLKQDDESDNLYAKTKWQLDALGLDESSETGKMLSWILEGGWKDADSVANFALSVLEKFQKDIDAMPEDEGEPEPKKPANLNKKPGWWDKTWAWKQSIKKNVFSEGTEEEKKAARAAMWNFLGGLSFDGD